ncbi:MAG: hypothetical protein H6838_06265 [Planctomycetes bacterium]|nr:hypothetical protein [Planctomycetota bacterium]MCB9885077.1 hypothetical protein [Planctomycetota bacterium]
MARPLFAVLLFAAPLAAPLAAQRALLDELPGDAEAHSRVAVAEFGPELTPLDLPGKGLPRGVARVGDRLWLARGDELLCVSWPQLALLQRVPAPAELVGLASDGKQLFGASADRVFVVDAIAGRAVREVELDAGPWIVAIGHYRGALHVVTDRKLRRVSLEKGTTEVAADLGDAVHWLAADGDVLYGGTQSSCEVLRRGEVAPGWSGTVWSMRMATSAATWIDGRLLLLGEAAPQDGGHAVAGLLDPKKCLPFERLLLRVVRGDQQGALYFEVGPKVLATAEALERELRRIAKDPGALVRYPDGSRALMPVVIETLPGVTIAELRRTWDLATAAGFGTVVAPEPEAWGRYVLRQRREREEAEVKRPGK